MNVLVRTPHGIKRHGYVKDGEFIRNIDGRYIRWSDKCFTINVDAILDLLETQYCTFIYTKAKVIETHRIETQDVLQIPLQQNEHGEYNFRIPITDCVLVNSKPKDSYSPPSGLKISKPESEQKLQPNLPFLDDEEAIQIQIEDRQH